MRKLFFVGAFLVLSSCGYDGGYRYECQDPANWGAEECNPPLCNVNGDCTETLLGFDPTSTDSVVPTEIIPLEPTEETVAP